MTVNTSSDISGQTAILVLKINSLYRSPVSFSYTVYLPSKPQEYSIGFHNVAMLSLRSRDSLKIENPIPSSKEQICRVSLKPNSKRIRLSGNLSGALIDVGRAPLTYTRLAFEVEVYKEIKKLLIEVRFPDDIRGYVKQSKVDVLEGDRTQTHNLSEEAISYHHYSDEKVTHFFSIENVKPSRILISTCFRLKPSLVLNLLTPFLFGFLVLYTWLYSTLAIYYKLSITVALLSLFVTLWYKSQRYVVTSFDNLNDISYMYLPISWFIIVLQSLLLNNFVMNIILVALYSALVLIVAYTILRFLLYPTISRIFTSIVDIAFVTLYNFMKIFVRDYPYPSWTQLQESWIEKGEPNYKTPK